MAQACSKGRLVILTLLMKPFDIRQQQKKLALFSCLEQLGKYL